MTFRVSNITLQNEPIIPYDFSGLNATGSLAQGFNTCMNYFFYGFSIYVAGKESTILNMSLRENSPGGPTIVQKTVISPTVDQWYYITLDTPIFLPIGHYYIQVSKGDAGKDPWMRTNDGLTTSDCYFFSGNWQPQFWNLTLNIHVKCVVDPESVNLRVFNDAVNQKVINSGNGAGWANITVSISGTSLHFSIANSSPIEYSYSGALIAYRTSKSINAVTLKAGFANWTLKVFSQEGQTWLNVPDYQGNITGFQADYSDIQAFAGVNVVGYSRPDPSILSFSSVIDTITFKSPNKIQGIEIPEEVCSDQVIDLNISTAIPGNLIVKIYSETSIIYENYTFANGITTFRWYVSVTLPAGKYWFNATFFDYNNQVGFIQQNLTLLRVAYIITENISIYALETLRLNYRLFDRYSGTYLDGANVSYALKDQSGILQDCDIGNYTGEIDLEEYALRPGLYMLYLHANKTGYTPLCLFVSLEIQHRPVDLDIFFPGKNLHPGDGFSFSATVRDRLTGSNLLRPTDVIIKIFPTGGNPELDAIVISSIETIASLEFSGFIVPSSAPIGTYDVLIQIESDFYSGEFTLSKGLVIEPSFSWGIISLLIVGICTVVTTAYIRNSRKKSRRLVESTNLLRGEVFSNVIFYKFAKQGPDVIFSEHSLQEPLRTSTGAYFYTTIGQGSQYRTGLFGPLPFGLEDSHEVALIYATKIVDTSVIDPRLNRQNYFLIALITLPENIPSIDRVNLENQLESITKKIPDLSFLKKEDLLDIVSQIRTPCERIYIKLLKRDSFLNLNDREEAKSK